MKTVTMASIVVLMVSAGQIAKCQTENDLGVCHGDDDLKTCTKEIVTNADNCEPQPRCRVEYAKIEKTTVVSTLIVHGKIMHTVHELIRRLNIPASSK